MLSPVPVFVRANLVVAVHAQRDEVRALVGTAQRFRNDMVCPQLGVAAVAPASAAGAALVPVPLVDVLLEGSSPLLLGHTFYDDCH